MCEGGIKTNLRPKEFYRAGTAPSLFWNSWIPHWRPCCLIVTNFGVVVLPREYIVPIEFQIMCSKVMVKLLVFIQVMSAPNLLTYTCVRISKLGTVADPREQMNLVYLKVTWEKVMVNCNVIIWMFLQWNVKQWYKIKQSIACYAHHFLLISVQQGNQYMYKHTHKRRLLLELASE